MTHDFLIKFHQIEGETIGERQRNLNKLLKDVTLTPDEKQFILDNLNPNTYLESVFYVDILIHYRETDKLLEIFKEGNEVFVSKIMKQPWFFQEAFQNVAPKELTDNILPLLSFSIKTKLLKNLYHFYSEEKIDQVFDYVISRYGVFRAKTFITSCSFEKIASVFKNYKVKLSTHQLKQIYKKYPNLINIYLEEQNQYFVNGDIFENNFLVYLAQQNPTYFWELTEKCQINGWLKLGRRTTKKLIPTKVQEIVNNPQKYIDHLRHETLVRKLNKEGHFKQLYYNLFPRKTDTRSICNNLLKYYPKSHQYNLFVTTFNDILKEDIWNYPSCIEDDFLDSIIDSKIREAWAQLKFKESSDERYLKYYEINKSIPLIKEKINTTSSAQSRRKLLSLLVECCAVNKDLKSLEEVLKYFCVRHKNDDSSVRNQFMESIESHCDLEEFTDTHWKYIIEILNVLSLNREYEFYISKFRIKHIEYLFNNNGSNEDKNFFILEYIKELKEYRMLRFGSFEGTKNVEIQKIILLQTVENIDALIKDTDNLCYIKSELVAEIFSFNSTYPEKSINIQDNQNLVEYLKGISEGGQHVSYSFQQNFPKYILKIYRNEFENGLLNFYLGDKSFRTVTFDSALQWFLKYDPMVIVKNFDVVMETMPKEKHCFWNTVKQYNHISLDDKVIKRCLDQLENGDDNYQKPEFVEPLSIIAKPEVYIKTLEDLNLIPTSSKIPVADEEARDLFQIQKAFLKSFQNVWNPETYLPLLIDKFCQGDYLRDALTPLCVAFHKIAENRLEVYLDKLANNKAMSVKKHGLYLASYVFPEEKVSQIFNSFQVDKNVSLQKCLCVSSLRYFLKFQTQEHFERLLSYLKFLKSHDKESLELLSSVQIPKTYKPYYLINFWNILDILKKDPNAVGFNELMSTVLSNFDKECFPNLPEDFCKAIIKDYFGKSVKGEEIDSIYEFTIKFLMYHENQTHNFNYVFLLLSKCKEQFFDLKTQELSMIHKFFYAFYNKVQSSEVDLEFIIKFSIEWNKVFSAQDFFKEHVLLNLSKLRREANGNIKLYSKNIVNFAEHISAQYGEFIYSKFCSTTAEFCIFGREENEIIQLLTEILKYKSSPLNCVLVMELITIKGDLFDNKKIRPIYHEINSILKQITDPRVQLCYNLYTKNDSL